MSAVAESELDYTLSTYEGWRTRASLSRREKPESLTMAQLKALRPEELKQYNNLRSIWTANLGPFITPQMDRVFEEIDVVVQSNRQDGDKVRSSPVLDANPGLGKTTLIIEYGVGFHREQIEMFGATTPSGHERIPVAMISLSGNTTMRGLNSMLCHFYAHPSADRGTAVELGKRAAHCARETATRLIIVDDAHFLNPNTSDGRELANHFKSMATEFQATIVFVGVGLDERGLFREGLGPHSVQFAQTARRWTRITLEPFSLADEAGRRAWRELLLAIESALVLARKREGMLADDLFEYLLKRSSGHFESLMALIRRGCHVAVISGAECLSESLLDRIKNDAAAEQKRQQLEASLALMREYAVTSLT